jgi:hypothetical protein
MSSSPPAGRPPEEVIEELTEQFRPIMEHSPDGVYLWLDEAPRCATRDWLISLVIQPKSG